MFSSGICYSEQNIMEISISFHNQSSLGLKPVFLNVCLLQLRVMKVKRRFKSNLYVNSTESSENVLKKIFLSQNFLISSKSHLDHKNV